MNVFGWNRNTNPGAKSVAMRCALFVPPVIQIVRLGGPDCLYMYCEYAPYTIIEDGMEAFRICKSGEIPGEEIPWAKKATTE